MISFAKVLFVLWAIMFKAAECDCVASTLDANVDAPSVGTTEGQSTTGKCKNNDEITVTVTCPAGSSVYTYDPQPSTGCPCKGTALDSKIKVDTVPTTFVQGAAKTGGTCAANTTKAVEIECSVAGKGLLYYEKGSTTAMNATALCGAGARKGSL